MSRHATTVLALLLFLVVAPGACRPGGSLPESADPQRAELPDSVAVAVDNQNYLTAVVRLYARGSQVQRISVTGLDRDTIYVDRTRLRGPGEVAAILELVGSRQSYRLPGTLLPSDASLIQIHVAQLLSTSSLAVF